MTSPNGSASLDMQRRVQDAIEFLDTTFDFNPGVGGNVEL